MKDVDDDTSTIIKNKQYSLITELSEDELFGKISKNFRYEIRRAQKEDTPYVFHSYIVDMEDKQVRLLHSCSSFRSEKLLANLIGRINKLLHWEDMIYFKKCGIRQYDWGEF